MVRKYFGTDGIRGKANEGAMTAETALRVGMAAGRVFRRGDHRHRVVIGKDTRLSGYMLEPALTAGFTSMGMILLVFKNRIKKYSMETGAEILEKEFPQDNFGELKYFVGRQVFTTSENGELSNLRKSDTTKVFVFTSQGKTLSLDNNLNVTKTIDYKDLSIYYEQTSDYKFIAKDKNTLIVNNEGKRLAEVEATSKSFVIDKTLYNTQDNKFITIDLDKIITNE